MQYHHFVIPEHFSHPKKKPVAIKESTFPSLPVFSSLNLFSVSLDLLILDFHINGITQYWPFMSGSSEGL